MSDVSCMPHSRLTARVEAHGKHELKGADMNHTSLANKLGLMFVVLLTGAFALTTMPVLLSPAVADNVAGARDDDVRDIATVSDDDDDDDDGDDDSRPGKSG